MTMRGGYSPALNDLAALQRQEMDRVRDGSRPVAPAPVHDAEARRQELRDAIVSAALASGGGSTLALIAAVNALRFFEGGTP
jgi:hypothetical protein